MDQRTFEQKVSELANKLKRNKVAVNDSQARMMAKSILETESRPSPVQRNSFQPKEPVFDTSLRKELPIQNAEATPQVLAGDEEFVHIREVEQPVPAKEPSPAPQQSESGGVIENSIVRDALSQKNNIASSGLDAGIDQNVPISELLSQTPEEEDEFVTDKAFTEVPPSQSTEKKENPKVDLHDMFNFSKRR